MSFCYRYLILSLFLVGVYLFLPEKLNNFQTDYVQIPNDVDVYIFCGGGGRALLATTFLKRAGYTNRIVVMRGGMTKTIKEGYTLVPYTG